MGFVSSLSFFCAKDGLAESERFYGGTLGLDVAFRTPTAVLYRVTDTAFFGITAGPGRVAKEGAAIVDFVVESVDEVHAWHKKITDDGWETDGPPKHADLGATLFFATDPNGYLVEILHFDDPDALTRTID